MIRILSFLILLSILVSTNSCQEDTELSTMTLADFFERQRDTETFKLTPTEDVEIIGKQGTKLTIPFENFSPDDGEVTIVFEEFLTKSELILNNLPTNAKIITDNDAWLETGGSFYVKIEDEDGERIFLEEPMQLNFSISDNISNPSNMSLWSGGREQSAQFGIWRPTAGVDGALVEIDESLSAYDLFNPGFLWINCDYEFESAAERVPINATVLNEGIDPNEIRAYVVFEDINVVVALWQNPDMKLESFLFPIGEAAHLVVMAAQGDLLLKIIPFTVEANQDFDVTLEPVTEDELIEAVGQLN